jgi:antitoxin HicB
MTLSYPIKLEADDSGTLLATCPALPEVSTFGEDEAEAINHTRDAIEEAIAARMADGQEVPEPRGNRGVLVALPMQTSLKVELYRLLTLENVTRAELMRRLNCSTRAPAKKLAIAVTVLGRGTVVVLSEEEYSRLTGAALASGSWMSSARRHCETLRSSIRVFAVPFAMSTCDRLSARHKCHLRDLLPRRRRG